jgi:hypothetical protein
MVSHSNGSTFEMTLAMSKALKESSKEGIWMFFSVSVCPLLRRPLAHWVGATKQVHFIE